MERDTELLRCLALVRPVGMSDDMASDWLAAALFEVRDMGEAQFRAGCRNARSTCTHHAQIIPAIMQGSAEASKPDPFAWALECHKPSRPVAALMGGDGPKRIGQVIRLPRPE